jgi:hypothetical protein
MHASPLSFAFAPLLLALAACSSSSDGAPAPGTDSSTTSDTATVNDTGTRTDTSTTTDGTPADAGDTWDSYANGFFAKYCIECHAGTKRDYRTPDDVRRDLALIRCGVASTLQSGCTATDPKPKQFPINDSTATNPKPTDAERDRIVAWLAAGAP